MNIVDHNGHLSPDAHAALDTITAACDATLLITIVGTQSSAPVAGLPGLYHLDLQRDEIEIDLSHVASSASLVAGTPAATYWTTLVHAVVNAWWAYWAATRRPGTPYAEPIGSPAWEQYARPIADKWVDFVIEWLLAASPTLWQPLRLGPYLDGLLTAEIHRLQQYVARVDQTSPGYGRAHGQLQRLYAGSRHIVQLSHRELALGLGIDLRDRVAMAQLDGAIARRGAGIRVPVGKRILTFFTFGDLVALRTDLGQGSSVPANAGTGCLIHVAGSTPPPSTTGVSTAGQVV